MELFPLFLIFLVFAYIYSKMKAGYRESKELQEAQQAYQAAISYLKKDPINAELKQRALNMGRVYSNLTRDKKGRTVFDEIALMNDINAACAAAGVKSPSSSTNFKSEQTIEERLSTLADLRSKSLISIDEYDKRRAEILSSV